MPFHSVNWTLHGNGLLFDSVIATKGLVILVVSRLFRVTYTPSQGYQQSEIWFCRRQHLVITPRASCRSELTGSPTVDWVRSCFLVEIINCITFNKRVLLIPLLQLSLSINFPCVLSVSTVFGRFSNCYHFEVSLVNYTAMREFSKFDHTYVRFWTSKLRSVTSNNQIFLT